MSYVDTINENKTYQQKIDRILITALRHDCQIFLAITKNLTKTATFIPWTAQKTHSRSVSQVSGRQHLRSASRRKLNISRFHRSTGGTRAFPVAITTAWSSLSDSLRDPAVESKRFRWDLKTHLFANIETWAH